MAVAMDKGATHTMSDGMGMSDGMMMMEKPAITLSGDGRMGVISDSEDNLKFDSRIRIKVTAAKELDNGLSAGGEVRTDQNGTEGKAGFIYLSGPFGKLSMGDVDAGAKAAIKNVDSVGYRNQGDPNEINYLRGGSGDDPTLQYMLPKMGPVQVWASVGMADVKKEDGTTDRETEYSFEKYGDNEVQTQQKAKKEISADTLSVGARADLAIADMGKAWIGGGYEASTVEGQDGHIVLGAGVEASGFTGKVVAGMQGRDAKDGKNQDVEQFGVSAGYSAGQIGVTVFYTDDSDMGDKASHAEAFGAGFSWSLGGGASLNGGITSWPATDDAKKAGKKDQQTADLGVKFSF